MDFYLAYLALGAFVGVLAGLFGVGGGLVIVPALVFMFTHAGFAPDVLVHLAIGSSLATIIFTSISSIYAHNKRGAVAWALCWQLTPGIVVGAVLGAMVADLMTGAMLRRLFAVFEWLMAAQLLLGFKPTAARSLPGPVAMSMAGSAIGGISSIVGIGGGTVTVPFLLWRNVATQVAVATSSACGLVIAVVGSASFAIAGWHGEGLLPPHASGFVFWPAVFGIAASSMLFAPLGAALAHRWSADTLRRSFGFFLIALGTYMFVAG